MYVCQMKKEAKLDLLCKSVRKCQCNYHKKVTKDRRHFFRIVAQILKDGSEETSYSFFVILLEFNIDLY